MTTIILELEEDALNILRKHDKDVVLTTSLGEMLERKNPNLYDFSVGSGLYQQIERTLEKRQDVERISVIGGRNGCFRENGYRIKK